ncbi:MAG: Lsr2 family protein [Mycobacterium sp.]
MAERVVHLLIDDLDGSQIPPGKGERLTFALRGTKFRIDLSEENVAKLDAAMQPYVDAATQIGGRRRRTTRSDDEKAARMRAAAIRRWAQKNGYDVSRRGRLASAVVEAFEAAMGENCA